MTVLLTLSEFIDGAGVSDSLAGGGTGIDLGSVVNGSYTPIGGGGPVDNSGAQQVFIRHNALTDLITDVQTLIQEYGVGTGFTFGGQDTAANDIATMLDTLGDNSGTSKNNGDDLSAGLWIDMNSDVTQVNQFDFAVNGIGQGGDDSVQIYGRGGGATNGAGSDLTNAITLDSAAMVIDSDQGAGGDATNGFNASAPVAGQIGKNEDGVLGDNGHLRLRAHLPSSFTASGLVQFEFITAYSFTA